MVFYFKSNVVDPPAILYMGRDKYESMYALNFVYKCLYSIFYSP